MFTKKFWKAAFVRAVKTFCQSAIAVLGTAATFAEADWITLLSVSGFAFVLSLLTSCALGVPEAEEKEKESDEDVG